jgi:hypothetical protein
VETPRKFITAKLSIRKPGSSSVLIICNYTRDGFTGGGAGGVLFFMIKQKIIRGKMRYSNLSNNVMKSEL